MIDGWYKVYRKLENWKYRKNPYMYSLWGYLLAHTAHDECFDKFGNKLGPGQISTSVALIAASTGLTTSQVRTCLDRLIFDNQISKHKMSKCSIITITNWGEYQNNDKQNRNQIANRSQSHTVLSLYKKNEKNIKSNFDFNALWNKYPNKDGKKTALRHFTATVKTKEDYANIHKALDNYLKSDKVRNGYIKNGSTWFNNWTDWIDYKPLTKQVKQDTWVFDE